MVKLDKEFNWKAIIPYLLFSHLFVIGFALITKTYLIPIIAFLLTFLYVPSFASTFKSKYSYSIIYLLTNPFIMLIIYVLMFISIQIPIHLFSNSLDYSAVEEGLFYFASLILAIIIVPIVNSIINTFLSNIYSKTLKKVISPRIIKKAIYLFIAVFVLFIAGYFFIFFKASKCFQKEGFNTKSCKCDGVSLPPLLYSGNACLGTCVECNCRINGKMIQRYAERDYIYDCEYFPNGSLAKEIEYNKTHAN